MACSRGLFSAAVVVVGCALLVTSCTSGSVLDRRSPLGSSEICDNGLDDDGDGDIDAADLDCTSWLGDAQAIEPPFNVCGQSEGDRSSYPVDMIWVLDGSPSMQDERAAVLNNLDTLANRLEEKRSNVRIVVIGGLHGEFCVRPPLGGPNCTDGERYMHVEDTDVSDLTGNSNLLPRVLDRYETYRSFLRPDSARVLVVVSDDNPSLPPSEEWPDGLTPRAFDTKLKALDPAFNSYIFHSIVAFSPDGGRHPTGCRGAVAQGDTYLELTRHTNGLKFSVCNQRSGDWETFFEQVAISVAGLVDVPCTYPRTVPFEGDRETSKNQLFVVAEIDGAKQVLQQFPSADSCGDAFGYYVDEDQLTVCPAVCRTVDVTRVTVSHGCPGGIIASLSV